jgi:predicted TPR repeat methyltransferase
VSPRHPDALHYTGVLAHKVGQNDEALAFIRASLDLVPDQADWHSNLGIVLQDTGDLEGAMAAFQQAIALDPAHSNAHGNLGVLLRGFGRLEEAEASYRTAIGLNPNNPGFYHNLAILLDQTGRTPEALKAYCKAITLKPSHAEARRHLALAYSEIGERDKAVAVCEEWVKAAPDDPRAHHALAAYSGRNVPARASDAYVQKVFDDFATGFEAKLARLHYRAPLLIAEALEASGMAADGSLDVLDAGCGTGLCGPLVAQYARRLVGVDLSGGMLNLAAEKKVYDELVQAELTEFLQRHHEAFDVVLTADTLVYFGGLEEVVTAAAGALRPGGQFLFTVEEATEPPASTSHSLQTNGRYVHGARYVERLLVEAGFHPHIGRAQLRVESGAPVAGLVVRAVKRDTDYVGVETGLAMGDHHA